MNESKHNLSGSGTYTAAVAFGGTPGAKNSTETWNGTAWTEVANLNTAGFTRAGTIESSTAALAMGGYSPALPGYLANTELWNGSSWTETADLSTARGYGAGAGTSTAGISFGGAIAPGPSASTEEFTASGANSTREFDLS